MMTDKKLVLASSSPRRRELLDQLGVTYLLDSPEIDETPNPEEPAADYVQRIATSKALSVARRHDLSQNLILAADTTVVVDDCVLGKPVDMMDGLAILARLSGRRHTVMTAICLCNDQETRTELVTTEVEFIQLTRELCEAYLATEEPWDKAGGYGIQGLGGAFVRAIYGSYSNVVGLPLTETWQLLCANGISGHLEPARE
jgi:septum formation protein